jgi:MATE family multidrug resistance protein
VPQLGASGAAWTAVLNFSVLAAALGLYVRYGLDDRVALGLDRAAPGVRGAAVEQRRYGYAAALSYGFEAGAFSVLTLFAGLLGAVAMAAHGIVYQFLVLAFMVALALATATQVRVGTAWGAGDRGAIAAAGWTGLGLAAAFAGVLLLLYASVPAPLVRLFTSDTPVAGLAAAVLPWIALSLLFDGGQSVMNQACRGLGDTWVPTLIQFGAYFGLMLPVAAWLAFRAGHGLAGLCEGIVAASVVSLATLAARFHRLSRSSPPPP